MFRAALAFEKDCLFKRDLTLSHIGKAYLFSWNTIIPGVLEVVRVKRLNEAEITYIVCVTWSVDTNSRSLILPHRSTETPVPKFCCDFWWVVMYSFVTFTQSERLWFSVINAGPLQHWGKDSWSGSGRKSHFCPVSWSTQNVVHTDDALYCLSGLFLIQYQCEEDSEYLIWHTVCANKVVPSKFLEQIWSSRVSCTTPVPFIIQLWHFNSPLLGKASCDFSWNHNLRQLVLSSLKSICFTIKPINCEVSSCCIQSPSFRAVQLTHQGGCPAAGCPCSCYGIQDVCLCPPWLTAAGPDPGCHGCVNDTGVCRQAGLCK